MSETGQIYGILWKAKIQFSDSIGYFNVQYAFRLPDELLAFNYLQRQLLYAILVKLDFTSFPAYFLNKSLKKIFTLYSLSQYISFFYLHVDYRFSWLSFAADNCSAINTML